MSSEVPEDGDRQDINQRLDDRMQQFTPISLSITKKKQGDELNENKQGVELCNFDEIQMATAALDDLAEGDNSLSVTITNTSSEWRAAHPDLTDSAVCDDQAASDSRWMRDSIALEVVGTHDHASAPPTHEAGYKS